VESLGEVQGIWIIAAASLRIQGTALGDGDRTARKGLIDYFVQKLSRSDALDLSSAGTCAIAERGSAAFRRSPDEDSRGLYHCFSIVKLTTTDQYWHSK
jgi:hypothetical protein